MAATADVPENMRDVIQDIYRRLAELEARPAPASRRWSFGEDFHGNLVITYVPTGETTVVAGR